MKKIIVTLDEHHYPIIIGRDLLKNASSFFPLQAGDSAMLVTSKTPASLYLDKIQYVLKKANIKVDTIILSDGEKYKNLTTLDKVITQLLKKKHGRDTTLIAFGGGVIGDLTGFAAASYQRGVRFIQIPTTFLSQVDSAIGGKTSVNHHLGKNMIGAFYQPELVIIDLNYLTTLPKKELISGFVEAIKYGVALDKDFFSWFENNVDLLLNLDHDAITYCVHHCCELKANIISIDEREQGLRTLLNLGHTYGHAIENFMGYGTWLHGEAVAAGIVIAARTSEKLGIFTIEETQRIINLFKRIGLSEIKPTIIHKKKYLSYLLRDKKILHNKLRLVLPISIGKSKLFNEISTDIVLSVLTEC